MLAPILVLSGSGFKPIRFLLGVRFGVYTT